MRANPIFGIGLNDWARPGWLAGSVDNFWLLMAMRYGVVGFGFLVAGLAFNFYHTVRADLDTEDERNCRRGYLVGSVSLMFSLATVHIWSQVALFVMFYFGAGAWMYTRPRKGPRRPIRRLKPRQTPGRVPPEAPERIRPERRFDRTPRRAEPPAGAPVSPRRAGARRRSRPRRARAER